MKVLLICALAFFAVASADVSELRTIQGPDGYGYPKPDIPFPPLGCNNGGVGPNCIVPQNDYLPPCNNGGVGPNCEIPRPPPTRPPPPPPPQTRPPPPPTRPPPPPPQVQNDYLPPCNNGGVGPNCEIPRPPPTRPPPPPPPQTRPPPPPTRPPPPPPQVQNDYLPPCNNGGVGPNCEIPRPPPPPVQKVQDDGYVYDRPQTQFFF